MHACIYVCVYVCISVIPKLHCTNNDVLVIMYNISHAIHYILYDKQSFFVYFISTLIFMIAIIPIAHS